MSSTLITLINDYGYIGIMLLILIENIFPPIPSEIVLVFGGFLTTQSEMSIPLVILFATLGATLGAGLLYMLGSILSRERIKRIFSGKFGRAMHLKPDDVTRAEAWFKRYEKKAVLICRCIPVVRSLISIPAGMSKMKLVPFFALTILGTTIWNTVLVFVGVFAGGAWETSLKYIGWYSTIAIVILLLAAAIVFYIYLKRRFIDNRNNDGESK
ncbi:MAG: alkaline phosphatase [Firmicutes bacterium HGW-Firmicutes-16]|nr:MAG: alkaline phosphatase [Firmicutes bacterium HGW-Firmicutes-16]